MKVLTFVITTLTVSAAGVAAGMLLAPKKGSKIRRDFSRKSHQYSDYLSDKLDDIIGTGADYLDDFEDKAGQLADKAKVKSKSK